MIRAVLLDMDGVIFDTERMALDYYPEMGRLIGYPLTHADGMRMLGMSNADCGAYLRGKYGAAFPFEEAFGMMYDHMMEAAGAGTLPEKAGMREALRTLRARGLKLAVASSNNEHVIRSYLAGMWLSDAFDALSCGDGVPHGKPAPDVFLRAAELLGVPPASCAGVEDSENGLRAVRAAGMLSIMVPDLTPFSEQLAPFVDAVCETLTEVPDVIAAAGR